MADAKISALTALTAPDGAADYAPVADASDLTATKKVLLKLFGGLPVMVQGSSNNPADATTYYFGPFATSWGGAATGNRIYVPRPGKLVKARLFIVCTTGTSETSTVSFRLNDTTDTTISSAVALNATPFTVVNSALSVAVAEDDYFSIKWVTPTWVTNPTGVSFSCQLWFV
jgi:hypothetical protein